jgi:hypothetical protein
MLEEASLIFKASMVIMRSVISSEIFAKALPTYRRVTELETLVMVEFSGSFRTFKSGNTRVFEFSLP